MIIGRQLELGEVEVRHLRGGDAVGGVSYAVGSIEVGS